MSTNTVSNTTESSAGAVTQLREGQRLEAFNIKQASDGKGRYFNRIGAAFVNRDGSINVILDSLPLDGRLHLRLPMTRVGEGVEG